MHFYKKNTFSLLNLNFNFFNFVIYPVKRKKNLNSIQTILMHPDSTRRRKKRH